MISAVYFDVGMCGVSLDFGEWEAAYCLSVSPLVFVFVIARCNCSLLYMSRVSPDLGEWEAACPLVPPFRDLSTTALTATKSNS